MGQIAILFGSKHLKATSSQLNLGVKWVHIVSMHGCSTEELEGYKNILKTGECIKGEFDDRPSHILKRT